MIKYAKTSGYTLIELLLYVSIVGSLLTAVSLYFATSTESRVKNQSIVEVNQQGALMMELITQTIRGADSITSPAAGASGSSLQLTVPTGSLSPTIFQQPGTVLGTDTDGTATDATNANTVNATKFTATASGTVSTLFARIGPLVGDAPNNQGQMAIYSGATNPTTLLASSASVAVVGNAWNAFTITPVSITNGQTYWLAYNTNAISGTENNLRYRAGAAQQTRFVSQTFGTWPASFTGTTQNDELIMYALIGTGSTALQIQQGANPAVALHNDKVLMTNLTFTNLTRSGTPGVVRVSFTLSRVNTTNRNEYSFEKTFTGTAALR